MEFQITPGQVNFLIANLLGMNQVDHIQLWNQFYLREEHQYKVKIDINVDVSFYIKKKVKVE